MKKPSGTLKFVVLAVIGVTAGIIVLSCAQHEIPSTGDIDKLIMEETRIRIPGTEISKDDQKAMNDILKNYDKSLYKIQNYENGKVTKERGTLSDKIIGEATAAKIAENAKLHGLNGLAIQAGFSVGTHYHVSPTPPSYAPEETGADIGTRYHSPTPSVNAEEERGFRVGTHLQHPTAQEYAETLELVRHLKPILEKYSTK